VAATKCRPSQALAEFVREGEIIGMVWTDPRCLDVPLPYPGNHDGLICAARPIGTAGECVQTDYQVPRARSGGNPFDGGVTRSPPAWCKGLRRWCPSYCRNCQSPAVMARSTGLSGGTSGNSSCRATPGWAMSLG